MELSQTRRRLLNLLNHDPEDADLAEAALLISTEAYPDLGLESELARIQDYADEVQDLGGLSLMEGANRLTEILHGRHGFTGDTQSYYDPQNSFLNRVMDRKRGLPILLSILYVSVARRCGLKAEGLALPGHFALRLRRSGERSVFLDPFHGGRIVKGRDVLIRELNLDPDSAAAGAFRSAGAKMVITRLLSNLKRSYAGSNALFQLKWVLELTLLVNTGEIPPYGPDLGAPDIEAGLVMAGADLEAEMESQGTGRSKGRTDRDLRLLSRVRAALN